MPEAIEQAPPEIVSAFLRGTVRRRRLRVRRRRSALRRPRLDVARAARRRRSDCCRRSACSSRIYAVRTRSGRRSTTRAWTARVVDVRVGPTFDLRIAIARSRVRRARRASSTPSKAGDARAPARDVPPDDDDRDGASRRARRRRASSSRYNLSEPPQPLVHRRMVTVVRKCSEYMHLDNSACNLASINLLKYLDDDGTLRRRGFRHTVEVVFTAQEILVGNADYPTEKIAQTSRDVPPARPRLRQPRRAADGAGHAVRLRRRPRRGRRRSRR